MIQKYFNKLYINLPLNPYLVHNLLLANYINKFNSLRFVELILILFSKYIIMSISDTEQSEIQTQQFLSKIFFLTKYDSDM